MKTSNLPLTIHELLNEAASAYRGKSAFTDGHNELSFEEIRWQSQRLAKHFLSLGLRKGDVLAVQLPNSIEFVIAHLAAAEIGLVFNPLSPNYRQQELTYMLRHCETKALIVSGNGGKINFEQLAYDVKAELPQLHHIIVAGEKEDERSVSFSTLLDEEPAYNGEIADHTPDVDDPALIMFTSGTESNPKAVLHSFRTFVAPHLLNGTEYGISEEDTIYSLTPLCHMFSLPMIMIGLHQGAKHYVYPDYHVEQVLETISSEQVSFLIAAPAHLIDLLHRAEADQTTRMNLRLVLTGGTTIPAQMVKDVRKRFNCQVAAQWGMTEVCAGAFTRPDDDPSKAWETVGRACPSGEIVILNDNLEPLPVGERGEIAFKGDCLFIEYYQNPSATESAMTNNGFFLTGDQGYLDQDGYVCFLGRTKDTINRGGLKFHASEIEEALQMHPKIHRAAVVSVPDARLGERACAYVTVRDEESFQLEDMKAFLLEKGFAIYKVPEYLEIRSELPTTPSGKISKGPLRSEARLLSGSKVGRSKKGNR